MALNVTEQYNKFVQFADAQIEAGNEDAIARAADEGANRLAARTVSISVSGDKVGAWTRSRADKDANNTARSLFRQAIVDIFGSEEKIPPEVMAAMKDGDNRDQGKPLTARRINAVNVEVGKFLRADQRATRAANIKLNETDISNVVANHPERLPEDIRKPLEDFVAGLRAKFGEEAVPAGTKLTDIASGSTGAKEFAELRKSAQGRRITGNDIVNALGPKACAHLAGIVAGERVRDAMRKIDPGTDVVTRALGLRFLAANPGLKEELMNCADPAAVEAFFRKYAGKIEKFASLSVQCDKLAAAMAGKAEERLVKALGLDPAVVKAHISLEKITTKGLSIGADIVRGLDPETEQPIAEDFDVEGAFDKALTKFVEKLAGPCGEIDGLDMPESVKANWKAVILGAGGCGELRPAQLLEVANKMDVNKLIGTISGLPPKIAVAQGTNLVTGIFVDARAVTGKPDALRMAGIDDLSPLYTMLISYALAKSDALANAVKGAGHAVCGQIASELESGNKLSEALFFRALERFGGAGAKDTIVVEGKFLASIASEVNATLDKEGVTDAKIREDVNKAFAARASKALKSAKSLTDLTKVASESRTVAAEFAKALGGIAKLRREGLAEVAGRIADECGLPKEFVERNLRTDKLFSDSGKLRFIYDGAVGKMSNGEEFSAEALREVVDGALAKFTGEKSAVIKAVKDAGFTTEECAVHVLEALTDTGWTDRELVTVAKALSEDPTMKGAMRGLASMLSPEALASIDDAQLRDVFLMFGKTFEKVYSERFPVQTERWAGSPDSLNNMMKMTVELLAKGDAGLAKSLAGLEASGRLERIGSLMRADMAEIDLVKMDYMTLEQIKNKEIGENARALLNNKNLVYDAKGYADCMANYRLYNMTSPILTAITRDFAGANAVDTAKYADYVAKGRDIAAKYASELPEDEAIPLYNFARTLDWSEAKAEESEQALKRRAEEVKPA